MLTWKVQCMARQVDKMVRLGTLPVQNGKRKRKREKERELGVDVE